MTRKAMATALAAIAIMSASGCVTYTTQLNRFIPSQFHGEWNADPDACGTSFNDSRLRIEPDRLLFWESVGRVISVVERGSREATLTLSMSGEGQEWTQATRFWLSADEDTLYMEVPGYKPFARFRCP